MKLLEESIEEKLPDTGFDSDFFFFLGGGRTPKAQTAETKIDKWDDPTLRNFCAAKKTAQ